MIHRDEYGIICQHDIVTGKQLDGGDSIHRTGVMAFCGSEQDRKKLDWFISKPGELVRHPRQVPWNNPKNLPRDQAMAAVAGLYAAGEMIKAYFVLLAHEDRGWRCQNTEADSVGTTKPWWNPADWLAPDHRLHLKLCSGLRGTRLEYMWLRASIIWSCLVRPNSEQNNIMLQCMVAGREYCRMYDKLHPNWVKATEDYWGGQKRNEHGWWRDQKEIAAALIKKFSECL